MTFYCRFSPRLHVHPIDYHFSIKIDYNWKKDT
jgi:hypothetical protein